MDTVIFNGTNNIVCLLKKFKLWKVLRITAWMLRFVFNSKAKRRGVLTTSYAKQRDNGLNWRREVGNKHYMAISIKLELATDEQGLLRYGGCITGKHPGYQPYKHLLTKLVKDVPSKILKKGGLTMA